MRELHSHKPLADTSALRYAIGLDEEVSEPNLLRTSPSNVPVRSLPPSYIPVFRLRCDTDRDPPKTKIIGAPTPSDVLIVASGYAGVCWALKRSMLI